MELGITINYCPPFGKSSLKGIAMRRILMALVLVMCAPVYAQNTDDLVEKCVANTGVSKNSHDYKQVFKACEDNVSKELYEIVRAVSDPNVPNFVDEVVSCMAQTGIQPTDRRFKEIMNRCEKEVQSKLNHEQAMKKLDDFIGCLKYEIKGIDDGVSTASDIAAVATSSCSHKWQGFLLEKNELSSMKDYPSKQVISHTMGLVFDYRKTKNQSARKK